MYDQNYPILVKQFYENLKTHTYYDALQTTVEGKVITVTPEFFITLLNMKNEGVMVRMDWDKKNYEVQSKYVAYREIFWRQVLNPMARDSKIASVYLG